MEETIKEFSAEVKAMNARIQNRMEVLEGGLHVLDTKLEANIVDNKKVQELETRVDKSLLEVHNKVLVLQNETLLKLNNVLTKKVSKDNLVNSLTRSQMLRPNCIGQS